MVDKNYRFIIEDELYIDRLMYDAINSGKIEEKEIVHYVMQNGRGRFNPKHVIQIVKEYLETK